MHETIAQSLRPSLAEVTTATASAVLAFSGLLAMPWLASEEPASGFDALTPADAGWWFVAAIILVQSIALLWVKRAPRIVLAGTTVGVVLHALVVPADSYSLTTIAGAFAAFWVVVRVPPRSLPLPLVAVFLVLAVAQAVNDVRVGAALDLGTIGISVIQALSLVGIPLVLGLFFAARQDARDSRSNELLALKRERDALIQTAVSRERMAMSRELHDIAAHHMSGIALLASAIYRQVDVDPEAAKIAAQQVRAQSTTVLDDLRRVIGLLRDDTDSSRIVESLAAVRELVELRRSAGTDVQLLVHTAERELGAGIGPLGQLVAYRMVQEALANAATHAPGANCVVELDDRDAASLTVRVTNDGAHAPDLGPGGGFGLVGMRERAELVDAELHYGATADGGWQVRLTLTRENDDRTGEPE